MGILIEILLRPIGWLYLSLRYRNKGTIKKVLGEKYENRYIMAALSLFMGSFAIIWIGLLVLFLAGFAVALFRFGP